MRLSLHVYMHRIFPDVFQKIAQQLRLHQNSRVALQTGQPVSQAARLKNN